MSVETMSDAAASVIPTTGSSLMSLLPMVIIFAIFYFFLIRPQLRRQKQVEQMIAEVKKGDKVVAAGGIHGVITKIEDNIVTIEIAENIKIKASKGSITEVLSKENKQEEKPVEAKKSTTKVTKTTKVKK
ncbi:MAG: preprotein translocase subunit YajC [Pseudomonadota bacterium]